MNFRDRLEKIENLKEKVRQINLNHKKQDYQFFQKSKPVSLAEIIEGDTVETPYGPCFYTEKTIPLHTAYGDFALGEVDQYFSDKANLFMFKLDDDGIDNIRLDQALFFDTETTGLAGGAGTYIFLLGLGFFTADAFCVRQYFMSDYHEEEALLWAVNQLFTQDYKLLITYNGKCYDFPLMQTRFIMARQPLQLADPYHLDLLYPTRRLWKKRLQDCSLSNIEKRVLNIVRGEDIPGYLIPQVYFRYLQNKDARPLKPVFEHNLQDIISLAVLTAKIGQTITNPLHMNNNKRYDGIDLCSIGKIYENNKDYELSSRCYEEALNCNLSDEQSLEILKLCSFAYKRQENWEKAENAWKDIISLSSDYLNYPYEELAKYYEHRLKDYQKGINIVEAALLKSAQANIDWESKQRIQEELNYRLARIKKKAQITRIKGLDESENINNC
ncbi:MAG: ribonuclease H-like domain-containing protein [Atribacterota bacterium]|nr:ribonuclease H-like domain-containing protein [Atribacterota bacterium]